MSLTKSGAYWGCGSPVTNVCCASEDRAWSAPSRGPGGGGKGPGQLNCSPGGGVVSLAGASRTQSKVDTFWASADLALRPVPPFTTHGVNTHAFSGYCLTMKQAHAGACVSAGHYPCVPWDGQLHHRLWYYLPEAAFIRGSSPSQTEEVHTGQPSWIYRMLLIHHGQQGVGRWLRRYWGA